MSLFATSATTSYAQSDDGQSDKEATLQQGVWALQFQIKENFTLSAFEGTTLSVKRHTSATRAWRLGVSLGATFENSDSEDGDQSKVDRQQIALIGHYLFYPTLKDPIHLYVGPGLRGAYSRASTKNEQRRPNGELILLADGSVFEWTVGLSGTLGVEWFANKASACWQNTAPRSPTQRADSTGMPAVRRQTATHGAYAPTTSGLAFRSICRPILTRAKWPSFLTRPRRRRSCLSSPRYVEACKKKLEEAGFLKDAARRDS